MDRFKVALKDSDGIKYKVKVWGQDVDDAKKEAAKATGLTEGQIEAVEQI
jgi:hypothetical protein